MSRIYNSIGILSPITIQMFQELCAKPPEAQLLGELLMKWKKVLNEFQQVEPLRFPRYFKDTRLFKDYSDRGVGAI